VVTLLADVAATLDAVAGSGRRSEKAALLAALLGRLDPDEVEVVVGLVTGRPRQGRVGVGWRTIARVDVAPAPVPALTVVDLDRALEQLAAVEGSGAVTARQRVLSELLGRATDAEARLVWAVLAGEMRQGALDGVVADAIARAASVPLASVRRAAMLSGDLGRAGRMAVVGGAPALDAVGLTVLVPVQPMLAATASSVTEALAELGTASVEHKLDGARIQVHRDGERVQVFTRNLNDVTGRLAQVVDAVRTMPATRLVLDGEALGIGDDGRPRRFQDTMGDFGAEQPGRGAGLRAFFFDVLHVDGTDLLDEPLVERRRILEEVAGPHVLAGILTADAAEAEAFARAAVEAGHEGVMVKALYAPYDAGRRGAAWRKVKPVHTLDLVVLAAEWGHGRRTGWLSNLHLGARGPDGGFVMVGKTFKGLTDELLRWQTERFQQLALGTDAHVVHLRPEVVVEVAVDGVQVSRRYPGGVALRFARVRRYRPDKGPADVDPIDHVRSLLTA
jgi:DNA ligase-1